MSDGVLMDGVVTGLALRLSQPPAETRRQTGNGPRDPVVRPKPDFAEPDWTRIPGFHAVRRNDWDSATWQRKHSVKSLRELKNALGSLLPDALADSIARDQNERAGMPILLPPHVLNTMNIDELWNDPVRRYMLPASQDRLVEWPLHPKASSDSLHEQEMWAVEGLTHRYPNKVLVELIATCPQYQRLYRMQMQQHAA